MTAANTKDCFREFTGQRLAGVIFDALPLSRRDIAAGTKTLIFEDGRGLTISSKGSYWIDSAADVKAAVGMVRRRISDTQEDLFGVLELAGRVVS